MKQTKFHGIDKDETKIYKAGYNTGWDDCLEDVEKIINEEIEDEKIAVDDKTVRYWDILKELNYIKKRVKELK